MSNYAFVGKKLGSLSTLRLGIVASTKIAASLVFVLGQLPVGTEVTILGRKME
ncbi:MAG TPA: hypothetical protein V6D50_27335 [Chroococcales cyanobacterium]